jgi:hypothetical protein
LFRQTESFKNVSCANQAQQRQAAITTEAEEIQMASPVVADRLFGYGMEESQNPGPSKRSCEKTSPPQFLVILGGPKSIPEGQKSPWRLLIKKFLRAINTTNPN